MHLEGVTLNLPGSANQVSVIGEVEWAGGGARGLAGKPTVLCAGVES